MKMWVRRNLTKHEAGPKQTITKTYFFAILQMRVKGEEKA
jgi:hypothetical protein